MSGSSEDELLRTGHVATTEQRREVTAVSIPGRFLPAPAAAEPPVARMVMENEPPSAEVAAAVHRLVASTDEAARGLAGFCWEPEEAPAAAPRPRAAVLLDESAPLPQPLLPAVDFPASPVAAQLPPLTPNVPPTAAELPPLAVSFHEAAPTTRDAFALPQEAADLPSAAAPSLAAAQIPAEVPTAAREASVIPSTTASVSKEAEVIPSEVAALPQVVAAANAAQEMPPEVAAVAHQATAVRADAPTLSEVPAAPRTIVSLSVNTPSAPATAAHLISDAPWAPVGFSPEMLEAATPAVRAVTNADRSAATPPSAVAHVSQAPPAAAVALPPRTGGTWQVVVWTSMLRAWPTLRQSGQSLRRLAQRLVGAGLAQLHVLLPRIKNFWQRIRSAASHIEFRLAWPMTLRLAIPWLVVGGFIVVLGVLLFLLLGAHVPPQADR